MTISLTGSVGGSPDGNPEHGIPTQLGDWQFESIDELIAWIKQNLGGSTKGGYFQGEITIGWYDQE